MVISSNFQVKALRDKATAVEIKNIKPQFSTVNMSWVGGGPACGFGLDRQSGRQLGLRVAAEDFALENRYRRSDAARRASARN